jgi:hypothetical protein
MASFNKNDCVEKIVPGLCGPGRAGSQMSAGIRDFARDRSRDLRGLTAKGRIPENGRVQNPNSYGRDPNPPKDKRR